jgi:hypothetical protein
MLSIPAKMLLPADRQGPLPREALVPKFVRGEPRASTLRVIVSMGLTDEGAARTCSGAGRRRARRAMQVRTCSSARLRTA